MRLYLHNILLSLLICSAACPALHADTASATPVKSDINQAQITDGNFKFHEIIASDPAAVASITLPIASAVVEIPVQEIPAIDNLLQVATQTQPKIKTLTIPSIPVVKRDHAVQSAKNALKATASGGIELKPGLNPKLNETPLSASATAAIAGAAASQTFSATASAGANLIASATTDVKGKKDSEYIDTLFPDPLSPDFPSENGISETEKNRPVKEVIDEINQKAEEIAERTARELGIEYIPPAERLPKTEPDASTASASDELGSATADIASGEAKVVTEADSGSWEYPGDTKASAAAEIKNTQTKQPDKKDSEITVKENEITEEPETGVGSENIGEKAVVEEPTLASETVVTAPENEIIPVQWPDSPEDPEFATGSRQLFSEKTASATSSSGELPGLFEKAEALSPTLMTRGKPEDELSDINEIKKITGRLVPEKQPLGRRRHLYRWVLKTDDGRRIPLKSNLKLLTEVRNEKILDGKVNLSGHFIKSGMNEELQYFVVESATFADSANASGTADLKTGKSSAADKKGSQPVKNKNAATKPVETGTKTDKTNSAPKSGSSGTKNAAKKQDLPAGDQNLKKPPMPRQP